MASSIDQQFVEFVVKSLVSKPDAVKIERRIDEKGVLLELTVDPEDLGRVIGKRGATAQSLRTLLRALGTKNDARYNLKIVDNGEPRERRQHDYGDHRDSGGDHSASEASQEPVEAVSDTEEPSELPADESSKTSAGEEASSDEDLPTKDTADEDHDSMISKTREELKEFDDLEV